MAASMKTWVVGTAGLCAVVLGLGGFVLIKPQFDERAQLQQETSDLAASNDVLGTEVAKLKSDFDQIDVFRQALADSRVKIPDHADLASLLREIDATATATGVTLITSSPQDAQAYAAPEADTPTPEATETASAEPAPTPSASTPEGQALAEAAASLTDVDGLYAIPIAIDVVGEFTQIQDFLSQLQTGTARFFLAGTFTMTRLEGGDAGKLPATTPGQVEMAMEAAAFVLTPASGTVPEGDDQSAGAPVPSAPGRNPFNNGVGANG